MIDVKGLAYRYSNKERVFKSLDLEWPKGLITGLLGANGVGKTTLLKLLAGWVKYDQGLVDVLGFDPRKRQSDFLKQVYFVSQQNEAFPCTGQVYKNIHCSLYPQFNSDIWNLAVKKLDIELNKNLEQLSTGSLKKFYIAFALATKCSLIFLDEPTNPLDIPSKEQFRKLLPLCVDEEQTVIISTHQVRDLQQCVDSCWLLDRQDLISCNLIDNPQLAHFSLEQIFSEFHNNKELFVDTYLKEQL